MSEHQEAGFRRLHEWILERCQQGLEHSAGLDDSAMGDVEETDTALSMGLKAIRERPALFVHCQECLLGRRREVMRRRFVVALTQVSTPHTPTLRPHRLSSARRTGEARRTPIHQSAGTLPRTVEMGATAGAS